MPRFLQCQRCTACCRWPGQVRVSEEEIRRLAGFLGLSEEAFIQRYTRLAANRRGLALVEATDGGCIFLEGRDCRVQPVKPQQCRDFPNLWQFPGFDQLCRAVPIELEADAYLRRVAEATGRTPDDPLIRRQLEREEQRVRAGAPREARTGN